MKKRTIVALISLLVAAGNLFAAELQTLVPQRSVWKFHDRNQSLGTAWLELSYPDTDWSEGAGPLGGGDPHIVTTVDLGPAGARYQTIYLRKKFSVTNATRFGNLIIRLNRDDGAAIWLNGNLVLADGAPNPPSFGVYGERIVDGANESAYFDFPVSATNLVEGENIIAAMSIQANSGSSDLSFDLQLDAEVDETAPTITSITPAPGSRIPELRTIDLEFSEGVQGFEKEDVMLNGVPATNLVFFSPTIARLNFSPPATGLVQVTWAANHGIADANGNALAPQNWNYTLDPNAVGANVIISEFMADNNDTIRDEDGDESDWIELFNAGATPVNLTGWALTDTTNSLAKWVFPNVTINPNSYLIVFASSKNRRNPGTRLHTNFRLSSNAGGYLGLVNDTGVIVSEFSNYPAQSEDISYGRDRIDPTFIGFFTVPTPGGQNASSGSGFGPEVVFSVDSKTYVDPFTLTLSTENPNAEIRYIIVSTATTEANTNIPTTISLLYTNPIQISGTVLVRARAFLPGTTFFPGPPNSESYIRVTPDLANFTSDLPIVVIHTIGSTAISDGDPQGGDSTVKVPDTHAIIAGFDVRNGRSSLMDQPQFIHRGGVNHRGSSTQGYPKRSFSIEFWDEFNADVDDSFFGLAPDSDWVLYAPNQFDKVLMHNPVAYQISRDIGQWASRTRFVELFLNTSGGTLTANMSSSGNTMGNYNGIYVLEESVRRGAHRLDISSLQPEHTTPPSVTGGYIVKIDRKDTVERQFTAGNQALIWNYPDSLEMVTPQRDAQEQYFMNYVNQFYSALSGANYRDPVLGYAAYADVPAWIDHNILGVITVNADWMRLSGFLYKDRNGKLVAGPVWDFDRSQGSGPDSPGAPGGAVDNDWRGWSPYGWNAGAPLGGGTDYGTDFFNSGAVFANPWYSRMFTDPNFWQGWIDRYQEIREDQLSDAKVGAIIDGFADEVRNAVSREHARWGGTAFGGANTLPRRGTITATGNGIRHNWTHTFDGTYQGEVDFLKRWWRERLKFIDTNLLDKPILSRAPGRVTPGTTVQLSGVDGKPGTVIYYTTDGSDPRASGGGISTTAQIYSGPITINDNTLIIARAYNESHRNLTGANNPPLSSPWSGKREGTFTTHRPSIVISEIMYNPQDVPETNIFAADDYEFIEIKNIGNAPINISRYAFIEGIQFNFSTGTVTTLQPGAYAVVVRNETAFMQRFGNSRPVAGRFTGTLDNTGEEVTLLGGARELIQSVTYNETWYPITDGFGFSLVPRNETAEPDPAVVSTKAFWRVGSTFGGTPGLAEPPAIDFPQVVINEALSRPVAPDVDMIELHNTGTQPANVGGWFLTDDPGTPQKYTIPAGTTIPAGGYLVINETEFGGASGFGLGAGGDDLYLYSGDATNISGYFHGFTFDNAASGVSFGRHVISTGEEHFVLQRQNTFGSANAGPLVGPVVISEIYYHPPDLFVNGAPLNNAQDEFIELHNTGTTAAELFNSTNGWNLRGATSFQFPAGTTIPAGGYVIVVGFNPTNTSATAEWRLRFGVPSEVQIFGPLSGTLNNSGDTVTLARPETPNPDGSVTRIAVESVGYMDDTPWPVTPDGFGHALQRLNAATYANNPANWVAGAPTPGRGFTPGQPPRIVQQPQDTIGIAFTNLILNVVAENAVLYQWQFNGQNIPGGNSATLVVPNLQTNQAGQYRVIVLSDSGAEVSTVANVEVRIPAHITENPVGRNVRTTLGITNILTNITFTVAATSSTPISYQWRKNGEIIPGATNTSLSITNVEVNSDYTHLFDVMITDAVATRLSLPAVINILVNPVWVRGPQPVYAFVGDTIRIDGVVAGSTTSMGFRWRKRVGPSAQNLAFTTEPVLIIENVTLDDATAAIDIVATNLANPAPGVLSPNAPIVIWEDADGDRLPDILEVQYGFNPQVPEIGGDADNDGMPDAAEFIAGTNPTNATSALRIANFTPVALTNGLPSFQFTTVSNRSYSVEATSDLGAGWGKVADVNTATTSRTISVTDSNATTDVRFYRIVTPMRGQQ